MFLLVDWGNSRLKYLLIEESDSLQKSDLSPLIKHVSSSNALISNLSPLLNKNTIKNVLIASVRNRDETYELSDKFGRLGINTFIASTSAKSCGITCAYKDYNQLGVDRWLAVIGAYKQSRSIGVIDAGSALTVDLVSSDGLHLGGHILPGRQLLRDSLLETAQVKAGEKIAVSSRFALGRSTSECVDFGIEQMTLSYLNSVIELASEDYSVSDWIVTGGDGPSLVEQLSENSQKVNHLKFEYQPTIVFQGLVKLYAESA